KELPEQHRRLRVYDDRLLFSPTPSRQLLEQRSLPRLVYQAQMGTSHDDCLDRHPPPRLEVGELRQCESRLTKGIFSAIPREEKSARKSIGFIFRTGDERPPRMQK